MRLPWQKDKKDFHLGKTSEKGSRTFCMLPWVHLHSLPDGDILPCCVAPYDDSFGSLKDHSFKELWNGPRQKELRQNMLNEVKSPSCKRCYEIEDNDGFSMRQHINRDFSHHYDLVRKTKRDGTLKKMTMYYFDLRFSNVCNLKCLGCSPTLSSSWYDDYTKLHGVEPTGKKIQKLEQTRDSFWSELEHILPYVERAYFAGGEPLLMPEHYRCLDIFLKNKRSDVLLCYNTNFMVMDSCGKDIFDYWKKFELVSLSISIDDIGKGAEYFRFGSDWDRLVSNMNEVLENCPHVKLEVTCTVSLFNISRLPEIHHYLYSKGFIKEDGFFLNYLLDPHYLRSHNLPKQQKKMIIEKFDNYLDEVKNKYPGCDWSVLTDSFQTQIEFMKQEVSQNSVDTFNDWIKRIDNVRGTSLESAYPELSRIMGDHS